MHDAMTILVYMNLVGSVFCCMFWKSMYLALLCSHYIQIFPRFKCIIKYYPDIVLIIDYAKAAYMTVVLNDSIHSNIFMKHEY